MAFILATGARVYAANSYITPLFVKDYLGEGENHGSPGGYPREKILDVWYDVTPDTLYNSLTNLFAACIRGTDYFDDRWLSQLGGQKSFVFDGSSSSGSIVFNTDPNTDVVSGDYVRINGFVYYYRFNPETNPEIGRIHVPHLNESNNEEHAFSLTTVINENDLEEVTAVQRGASVNLVTKDNTDSGNYIHLESFSPNGAIFTNGRFSGGEIAGPQRLAFPRTNLFDTDGHEIIGIPLAVRRITAEYALRAAAVDLPLDPHTSGEERLITKKTDRVGPILSTVEYSETRGFQIGNLNIEHYETPMLEYISSESGGRTIRN